MEPTRGPNYYARGSRGPAIPVLEIKQYILIWECIGLLFFCFFVFLFSFLFVIFLVAFFFFNGGRKNIYTPGPNQNGDTT